MDEMTQQNAALVEEAAAAAENLQAQAATLSQAVAAFNVGRSSGLAAPRAVVSHRAAPALAAPRATPPRGVASLPKPPAQAGGDEVDFDAIIDAHQAWKQKLRNAIQGGSERNLNPDEVCKDNACALGKWIYGPGRAFEHQEAYENLRHSHADFHVCAADILRKAQSGDKDEANAMLVGDFFELSNRTIQQITAMKRQSKR